MGSRESSPRGDGPVYMTGNLLWNCTFRCRLAPTLWRHNSKEATQKKRGNRIAAFNSAAFLQPATGRRRMSPVGRRR
jgi:hypothetical protein